ncbi:hypothetical protein CYMTET_31143, partial [Cymbomonas tetramitiformis]
QPRKNPPPSTLEEDCLSGRARAAPRRAWDMGDVAVDVVLALAHQASAHPSPESHIDTATLTPIALNLLRVLVGALVGSGEYAANSSAAASASGQPRNDVLGTVLQGSPRLIQWLLANSSAASASQDGSHVLLLVSAAAAEFGEVGALEALSAVADSLALPYGPAASHQVAAALAAKMGGVMLGCGLHSAIGRWVDWLVGTELRTCGRAQMLRLLQLLRALVVAGGAAEAGPRATRAVPDTLETAFRRLVTAELASRWGELLLLLHCTERSVEGGLLELLQVLPPPRGFLKLRNALRVLIGVLLQDLVDAALADQAASPPSVGVTSAPPAAHASSLEFAQAVKRLIVRLAATSDSAPLWVTSLLLACSSQPSQSSAVRLPIPCVDRFGRAVETPETVGSAQNAEAALPSLSLVQANRKRMAPDSGREAGAAAGSRAGGPSAACPSAAAVEGVWLELISLARACLTTCCQRIVTPDAQLVPPQAPAGVVELMREVSGGSTCTSTRAPPAESAAECAAAEESQQPPSAQQEAGATQPGTTWGQLLAEQLKEQVEDGAGGALPTRAQYEETMPRRPVLSGHRRGVDVMAANPVLVDLLFFLAEASPANAPTCSSLVRLLLADVIGRCHLPGGGSAAGGHKVPLLGRAACWDGGTRQNELASQAVAVVQLLRATGWIPISVAVVAEIFYAVSLTEVAAILEMLWKHMHITLAAGGAAALREATVGADLPEPLTDEWRKLLKGILLPHIASLGVHYGTLYRNLLK